MKKILLAVLIVAAMLTLSSCAMTNEFLATLGFDTHDYEGEEIIETYEGTSEKADEMRNMVSEFLSVLFEANPKSIGGALPSEDFYFEK